jgi:hypothetical protein
MKYYYPFGEELKPVVQQDRTPKKVFVLGVYASAVHARWTKPGQRRPVCTALAVASEPRIFWDGNPVEASEIINRINFPKELGILEPADPKFNGPSAKVLDNHILAPLGFSRKDAWLCDLLPETRLNKGQLDAIEREYMPVMKKYSLNKVTIPNRPSKFCDSERCKEIVAELDESKAELLILLGDIPIKQFLNAVTGVDYKSLLEYKNRYGYGSPTEAVINGKIYKILPIAHPRQIGGLGSHSSGWCDEHHKWEVNLLRKATI